jgi:uncharacterized membrane protein YphA (DoxX/SURF4 family)
MNEALSRWLPIPLRILVVALVAQPTIMKFTSYGQSVEGFTGMGIPVPGLMVLVSGAVELLAVVAAILGLGRLPFDALTGNMVVALIAGGIALNAIAALVAALGLAVLGTGAFSLWHPEARFLPETSWIADEG